MPYPDDIEGVWSFFYFSYNKKEKQAVGFQQIGTSGFQRVEFSVVHKKMEGFAKFLLGGKHLNYPGANGQFANAKIAFGRFSYASTTESVIKKIRTGIYNPLNDWGKNSKLVTISRFTQK